MLGAGAPEAALLGLLGLLVGSFLNVVIHRLPKMMELHWAAECAELQPHNTPVGDTAAAAVEPFNLMVPRSRCPRCNTEIKAHQNIPLLSWLLLGGKCAHCRAPISVRYPVVELVTAALSAVVALRFGWQWQTLFLLVFTWALVALTVIDIDHTLLPDVITLPLLWLGLLCSLGWHAGLMPPAPTDPVSAIVGAAAGYLVLWSVYWLFKLATGKEGMGYGDFKLLAAIGAWLGWQMLPVTLLLSSVVGAVVGIAMIVLVKHDRRVPIPFGPYLAGGGLVALFFGADLTHAYLGQL